MRKHTIASLKMDQVIFGRVEEVLRDGELIIGFEGNLLRVVDETQGKWQAGDAIQLVVKAIRPIRFQLLRTHGRLDVRA